MIDNTRFALASLRAVAEYGDQGGIGTLGEKLLHKTLKFYFEPDATKHEIPFCGSVADILNEEGIIEIQTRAFNKLVPKLDRFLPKTHVTVVYPIVEKRTICRLDPESGVVSKPRKSSKVGLASDALAEISRIRAFIPHENLEILIVLLDADETRLQSGSLRVGRKKTQKINISPTRLNSIIHLGEASDYLSLLPRDLPEQFTAAEFEKITRLRSIDSHGALMLLLQLGILHRERQGRDPYVYTLNEIS